MKKLIWAPVAMSLAMVVGCGGGDNKSANAPEATAGSHSKQPIASATAGVNSAASKGNVVKPTDPKEVVRVFFDAMRAGNGEQIEELFSSKAKLEIAKQGWKIQPLGSAQATFEVQDATQKDDVFVVSSKWTEPPTAAGEEAMEMDVLWVLRMEAAGWRICEMAVDPGTGEEYEVVNFENLEAPSTSPAQQPTQPASRVASLPGAATDSNTLPSLPGATSPAASVPNVGVPGAGFPSLPPANQLDAGALPPAAGVPANLPPSSGFPALPPASLPN